MSSPSPDDEKPGLPWIIQPGTYQWVDDIFNTPLKQWGVICACVTLIVFFLIILIVLASDKPKESFANFMKDAMKRKLVDLAM
jgi:hypothetical protein